MESSKILYSWVIKHNVCVHMQMWDREFRQCKQTVGYELAWHTDVTSSFFVPSSQDNHSGQKPENSVIIDSTMRIYSRMLWDTAPLSSTTNVRVCTIHKVNKQWKNLKKGSMQLVQHHLRLWKPIKIMSKHFSQNKKKKKVSGFCCKKKKLNSNFISRIPLVPRSLCRKVCAAYWKTSDVKRRWLIEKLVNHTLIWQDSLCGSHQRHTCSHSGQRTTPHAEICHGATQEASYSDGIFRWRCRQTLNLSEVCVQKAKLSSSHLFKFPLTIRHAGEIFHVLLLCNPPAKVLNWASTRDYLTAWRS